MWSWETLVDGAHEAGAHEAGAHESGTHEYPAEDILGQAAMTEAMFDWLADDKAVHPLNLDLALQDFNIILGMYMSALGHRVVDLPVEPEVNLMQKLRARLSGE